MIIKSCLKILTKMLLLTALITGRVYSQNDPEEPSNLNIKTLFGGGYYVSNYNNIISNLNIKDGLGFNLGLIFDLNNSIDFSLCYSHFGYNIEPKIVSPVYNYQLSGDNFSMDMKIKLPDHNLVPYILFGLTGNWLEGKMSYDSPGYDKYFYKSYLTENLGIGASYKLSGILELDANVRMGFLLSEFEIDRFIFNLGLIVNLSEL